MPNLFNRVSSSHRTALHWRGSSDFDQTGSGWTVQHPKIPQLEKNPLGPEGGPFGAPEISIKGKINSWFKPWLSMNQKFSWVAWRGAQTLSQITPKIFGSGPSLILQATQKFFSTPIQHGPAGSPHIAIFALTSSYAPKTSNFMIRMLVCWVRIKFGWKLSRQFLGIFSMNFALLYGSCLTYYGVWALKIYGF